MPFYKFLDKNYLRGTVDEGVLKISSINHYRNLEITSKTRGIGDENENTTVIRNTPIAGLSDNIILDELDINQKRALKLAFGDIIPKGWNIHIAPTIKYVGPDHHIWCFSVGNLEELIDGMRLSTIPGLSQYDAAIEILDIDLLSQKIGNSMIISPIKARMNDYFSAIGHCDVEYVEENRMIDDDQCRPDPCIKENFFASQKESRLIIFPPNLPFPDTIYAKIDAPHEVFRVAYLQD